MAKIISIVNQKGGVGKTTTSVNLSAYLANLGRRVLLLDLDPQANASSGLGLDHRQLDFGIYEALLAIKPLYQTIKRTLQSNLRISPATPALAGASIELVSLDDREYRLARLLEAEKINYDYIIIDAPPSLGLLTINSLVVLMMAGHQ